MDVLPQEVRDDLAKGFLLVENQEKWLRYKEIIPYHYHIKKGILCFSQCENKLNHAFLPHSVIIALPYYSFEEKEKASFYAKDKISETSEFASQAIALYLINDGI